MSDTPRTDFRYERVRLAKPCACGSEVGVCAYTYAMGLMVANVWACVACGATLHEWEWNTNQIACKEARAVMLAEQQERNNLAAIARDARNLPSAPEKPAPEGSVPWDKPPKTKKQMDLF